MLGSAPSVEALEGPEAAGGMAGPDVEAPEAQAASLLLPGSGLCVETAAAGKNSGSSDGSGTDDLVACEAEATTEVLPGSAPAG